MHVSQVCDICGVYILEYYSAFNYLANLMEREEAEKICSVDKLLNEICNETSNASDKIFKHVGDIDALSKEELAFR